jgi:tetratricopeptide (TPR) repeat protein
MFVIAIALGGVSLFAGALERLPPPEKPRETRPLLDTMIDEATAKISAGNLAPEMLALAYVERAGLYYAQGNLDRAIADYRTVLGLVPEGTPLSTSIHRLLINIYEAAGERVKAIAECDFLIRAAPESYAIYLQRGSLYSRSGQYDNAIADFRSAIGFRPYTYFAYQARARAYARKGEYDKALADFETVVRLEPDLFWPRYERAWVLGAEGKRLASMRAYGAVVGHVYGVLFREVVHAYKAPRIAALESHAEDAVSRWDLDVAIADYTDIIRKEPNAYHQYLRRGELYLWDSQIENAFSDFNAAVRLAPNAADPHWYLGNAYGHVFQFEKAIPEFDLAIRIQPERADLHRSRGLAEFAQAQYAKAATDLEKALKLNPSDAYVVIWLQLTRVRLGLDDADELRRNALSIPRDAWPAPIMLFLMGEMAEERVQALATEPADYWTDRNQRCEADFYLGLTRLDRGHRKAALPLLQNAARACHPGFVEFTAAAWELHRTAESF